MILLVLKIILFLKIIFFMIHMILLLHFQKSEDLLILLVLQIIFSHGQKDFTSLFSGGDFIVCFLPLYRVLNRLKFAVWGGYD